MSTIESIISLSLENFINREEKGRDPKSLEKLFVNAFRTIENDVEVFEDL